MTTKEIGISLHEELDRREALIKQLTEEANAIRTVLGVLERPTPEQHNRVTKVVGRRGRKKKALSPPPTRRATDDTKRCKRCKRSAAEGATFGKFKVFADGLDNRCRDCRKAMYQERKTGKPNGQTAKPSAPAASTDKRPLVRCNQCGDGFPDAKAMGIHKTRAHFASER